MIEKKGDLCLMKCRIGPMWDRKKMFNFGHTHEGS